MPMPGSDGRPLSGDGNLPTMHSLLLVLGLSSGQAPNIEDAVRRARTLSVAPHAAPPAWMDDAKVRAGYVFLGRHRETVFRVMGTSSLAATFAAKDITPALMQTGRLPRDFDRRMQETTEAMAAIFDPPKDRADFVRREYSLATALGRMHVAVADQVRRPLAWNPKERVPMNVQAFALVLYTFAWWPVEAMRATKEIDLVRDAAEIDGWFHLWSVLGYGMGVSEGLLPRDAGQAARIVSLLRRAQYAGPGEKIPAGVPVLLGNHVRMVAAQLGAKATSREAVPSAAKALASLIVLSPGEADALGLGPDPATRLLEYAALPPGK